MKKMIIALVLFAATILISGCLDTEEKPSGTAQIPNSQPAGDLPANVSSANRAGASVEAVRLENYDGGFFSINKPAGWEVIPAGSCSTFSFLIWDKDMPGRQVF